ncbi:hypothetical protein pb186bvf_010410 [Paramecium bursaria]
MHRVFYKMDLNICSDTIKTCKIVILKRVALVLKEFIVYILFLIFTFIIDQKVQTLQRMKNIVVSSLENNKQFINLNKKELLNNLGLFYSQTILQIIYLFLLLFIFSVQLMNRAIIFCFINFNMKKMYFLQSLQFKSNRVSISQ